MNSSAPSPPVPVAIIGMGCMFPQAEDLARYWANIRNCVDAISEVPETHWKLADYYDRDPQAPDRTYAHRGGFLTPVDFPLLDFGISPHSLDATDTTQLLGLLVARAALDDAGYPFDGELDRDRVSVILGVTGTLELVIPLGARLGHPIWRRALQAAGVDPKTSEEVVDRIASSYVGWQENSFPGLLGNVAAGRIANRLDLRGTNCVVDAACASSLAALNLALLELAANRCDMAVTGGLDAFNDIFMYMCFSKTPALSPSGDARPFDASADGTVLGEGLGVMVLKRLEDARRDNDRIYAVIRSIGSSSDGKGQAVYAPSSAGQASALQIAYRAASISPGTVELVEAHGTGTRVGDGAELAALEEVYKGARASSPWCAIGSVKSQVGHTKAAAGAAGMIKAALALHHKVLPPTTKVSEPIEPLRRGDAPFYLNTAPRPWLQRSSHPRRAAVSAFGFGGSNFHCILEEGDPEKPGIDWDGDVQIVAFSGKNPAEVIAALRGFGCSQDWDQVRDQAAKSRSTFGCDERYRTVLVARRGGTEMAALIAQAIAQCEAGPVGPGPLSRGGQIERGLSGSGCAVTGSGPRPGLLAMLFPGQGSQYVGMLRELACQFPRMQSALSLLSGGLRQPDALLSDWIYPSSAFDETTRLAQERALRETRIAQAAIGAMSLGSLLIIRDFGVRPDLAGGHSFGELTALFAGGRIDEGELAHLACRRGELMADCAQTGDPGAMLAVLATLDDLERLLRDESLDLVVANRNAPRQHVLAGSRAEIERAGRLCTARRITAHPVAVSAAFHSRFVAAARDRFLDVLQSIEPGRATIPVFANTSGMPYPDDPRALRELLAGQLAEPVDFVAQINEMHRQGARVFVEVGPDAKLSGLVTSILEGRAHAAIALDRSRGAAGNMYDLASLLASLAALGYAVDLNRWDSAPASRSQPRKQHGLTAKISGANARPTSQTTEDRPENPRSTPAEPPVRMPSPATSSPRFSIEPSIHPLPAPDDRPRQNGTIEATKEMDFSIRMNAQHSNGEPADNRIRTPESMTLTGKDDTQAAAAAFAAPDVRRAFETAQENLLALQKLAAQTADVHRQFLEGQERIQQTFLKLVERGETIAQAIDGAENPVSRVELQSPKESAQATRSIETNPSLAFPVASDRRDRNGALESSMGPAPRGLVPAQNADVPGPVAPVSRIRSEAEPGAPAVPDPGSVAHIVIEVVSDKTGYPPEVLGLDMKLDADLGIDSIKRVEILSALHERLPGLPALSPEQVGALLTLKAIVELAAGPKGGARREEAATIVSIAASPTIGQVLLKVVAEKTGYPVEMLELDMKLDADLGIDSIKRVEILSALQDRIPGLPALKPEQLGTLRTLGEIAGALAGASRDSGFAVDGSGGGWPEPQPACGARNRSPRENGRAGCQPVESGLVSAARGAPDRTDGPKPGLTSGRDGSKARLARQFPRAVPLAEPDQRQEIRLPARGMVWITDDGTSLTEALRHCLEVKGYRARVISPGAGNSADETANLCGLVILAPRRPSAGFVGQAFRTLRAAGPALEHSGRAGGASLVTVSRLDGRFGVMGLAADLDPASGALAGLAKTAGREWAAVHCKAVDLDAAAHDPELAAGLIADEFVKRGPSEVGLTARERIVLELATVFDQGPAVVRRGAPASGDLIVISGGARGVTGAVARALAEAFQPRLVLFGRSPAPGPEDPSLAGLKTEAELKCGLLERSSRRLAPSELSEQARRIVIAREIRETLSAIEAAGSPVEYHALDVRESEAVRETLWRIRADYGPIRGLIHGAGTLADRRIIDQTDAQFNLVYDTKVSGLKNLLGAVELELLEWLILFSSSTARFGRAGQVAYAAANEVLNKWAQRLSLQLPACHVVSYNWGPWDGGMVTESLKPVFEREGIGLIPAADGGQVVACDLARQDKSPAEILVWAEPPSVGPPDPAPRTGLGASPALQPEVTMGSGSVQRLQTAFRREVSLDALPVLASHVLDGHAVLPMALIVEWLAEGAAQRNPGLVVAGLDDMKLYKGVVLNGPPSVFVELRAGKAARAGGEFRLATEMCGTLPDGREVPLARAEAVLVERRSNGSPRLFHRTAGAYPYEPAEIYRSLLFHGPAMQGIKCVDGHTERGISGWVKTAPAPAHWIERPNRGRWLFDPLAIDCAFQLVVLWSRQQFGASSLPTAVHSYRQYQNHFPADGVRVLAEIRQATESRALADIEFLDAEENLIARIDGYECVIDLSLNDAFKRNALDPSAARRTVSAHAGVRIS